MQYEYIMCNMKHVFGFFIARTQRLPAHGLDAGYSPPQYLRNL